MNNSISKEWKIEIAKIANKGKFKWQSTFCQKCGIDLKSNRDIIYGEFCIQCERDEKLEKLCG